MSSVFAKTLNTLMGKNAVSDWLLQREKAQLLEQIGEESAVDAMRRARFDPMQQDFVLTDVGLVAYRTQQTPKIVRYKPLVTDSRWLRPFVEIAVFKPLPALLQVGILDSQGQAKFWEEKQITLSDKQRLLTQNWLPLEGLFASGKWSLVVYVNGQQAGIHRFEWARVGESEILDQVHTDGEINEELQHAVRKGKFRKMSLDELLSDQEE